MIIFMIKKWLKCLTTPFFFPEKLKKAPGYGKGSKKMFYANISKVVYNTSSLPAGLLLKDNAIIADGNLFFGDIMIYAKDKTGNYLKKVESFKHRTAKGNSKKVYYFYGKPSVVEVYKAIGSISVDVPFQFEIPK